MDSMLTRRGRQFTFIIYLIFLATRFTLCVLSLDVTSKTYDLRHDSFASKSFRNWIRFELFLSANSQEKSSLISSVCLVLFFLFYLTNICTFFPRRMSNDRLYLHEVPFFFSQIKCKHFKQWPSERVRNERKSSKIY